MFARQRASTLAQPVKENSFMKDSVTFRDPRVSSLQASLQEKTRFRIATGNSHLRRHPSKLQTQNPVLNKKTTARVVLCLVQSEGFDYVCSLGNVQARSLSQAMITQYATGIFRLRFESTLCSNEKPLL